MGVFAPPGMILQTLLGILLIFAITSGLAGRSDQAIAPSTAA